MSERTLSSSPSMPVLFARAGSRWSPARRCCRSSAAVGGSGPDARARITSWLPPIGWRRTARYVDLDRPGSGGPATADVLPATYPHMLAFPLQLALMTDSSFPFPAIGLVHIVNRIVQHRPIRADERLSLRVSATPLEPHPRGRQFSIRTEARAGDELVWEEVSTNLRRGRADGDAESSDRRPATAIDVPDASDLPAVEEWKLAGDLGRRYGTVSGDPNPIHVHPLTARLFGFPSAIAHGMWTNAGVWPPCRPGYPTRSRSTPRSASRSCSRRLSRSPPRTARRPGSASAAGARRGDGTSTVPSTALAIASRRPPPDGR